MNDTARLEPIRPAGPRWPVPVIVTVLTVALCWVVAHRPEPRPTAPYTFAGLRTDPTAEGFTVTWASDRAYPSVIEVLSPAARTVTGANANPTTSHTVEVAGLTPDQVCTFVVGYPDGSRSLRQTVRTLPVRVELTGGEVRPQGGVYLYARCAQAGATCSAAAVHAGQRRPLTVAPREDGGLAVTIDRPHDLDDVEVTATLPTGGTRTARMATALRTEVDAVIVALKDVTADAILAETHRETTKDLDDIFGAWTGDANVRGMAPEAAQQERRKHQAKLDGIRDRLEQRLKTMGCLPAYEKACRLSPLALRTSLVDVDAVIAFHGALRRFQDVVLYMAVRHMQVRIPTPDWGDFALERQPPERRGHERLLFQDFARPVRLGTTVPFAAAVVGSVRYDALLDEAPSKAQRFAVAVTVKSFVNLALRVTVNDRLSFTLTDRPVHPEGPEVFTFYQFLPGAALHKGVNVVVLAIEPSVGRVAVDSVEVMRVALLEVPDL